MLRTILVNPLFNILLLIYALIPGHDFGLAVIILTILIRLLLWPLVKRQLHHQKAMKELQPEIAKIKAKTKGDRQKESQMMVELFKEKEINPFGSLGLALLQFPILIALFFVLRQITDPGSFGPILYSWVEELKVVADIVAQPNSFDPTFLGLVHMAKPNIVLALLAGLAQYAQARQLMPKNTTKTGPLANLGFNMTLIFPILTVAIAAQLPSALALYWAASSAVAVIQQQLVLSDEVGFMRKLTPARFKNDDAGQ